MNKLNAKHLGFILLGTAIVSLKTYPTVFTRYGGRDTWLAMIVASILAMLFLLFVIHVFKKSNFEDLKTIYTSSVGSVLGCFLLSLFILNLFFSLVECSSLEASSMNTNIVNKIGSWQLLLFFIISGLYAVRRGRLAIISVCMIAMILVSLSGINLSILTLPYKHLDYLKPILENGVTKGLMFSMLQILGVYGSLSIFFPYISYLGDTKSLTKYMVIAMLFVIQVEIISLSGVLMTFDIHLLNTMSYPKLLQTQLIDKIRFLEAGELFVMLQLIGGLYIKYVLCLHALLKMLEKLGVRSKYLDVIVSILCFIVSYFAVSNLFTFFKLLNYYSIFSLANFVVIPFLVFCIYLLRGCPIKKGEQMN